ncbi:lysoplasmalogenase family protein [Tenacibaculum sp.]|uniref:lysoplasmalogenase family protein n=1 Tax=Tenacibaculum sp. TaxID=1906242 RepID=UPI003AA921E9
MSFSFKTFSIAYIVASILSLFFIDVDKPITELIFKIFSLQFLSFLYLSSSQKINYWYLLILMSSVVSDALLIFEDDFIKGGVFFLLLNRVLYLIIARKAMHKTKLKTLLAYLIPGLILFLIISYLLRPYLKELSYSIFIICFLNATIVGITFFNFLNKMSKENLFFFLGIFLIITADFLIVYNKYVDYKLYYVIAYTIVYYIARYLICVSMIKKKSGFNHLILKKRLRI